MEEEWWDLGDVSGSASSEDFPDLAPWDEEGEEANPIVECLTTRGTLDSRPPASMDAHEVSTAPVPPMESPTAAAISTSMGKDQSMGDPGVSTVMASMETMDLEAPSVVVGLQGATVEELVEED